MLASANRPTLIARLCLLLLCGTVGVKAFAQFGTADTAEYDVLFEVTWSNQTHPHPAFPLGAHFTTLVGGIHSSDVEFWASGELATPGVEEVAELGDTGLFSGEVQTAVDDGRALRRLLQRIPFSVPNETVFQLAASGPHSQLTFITMIAPSPDWFTGVSGLELKDSNGRWLESVVVDLFPYDAGTEEGDGYSLSNPATNPPEAIAQIAGQSPFSDNPVARLTLVRRSDISFADSFEDSSTR